MCVWRDTDRVAHVGLEAEALRRAEGGGVEAQQALPVAGRVQTLHGPFQHLQTRPPGGFQAQLGGQIGPQRPAQTGVVP